MTALRLAAKSATPEPPKERLRTAAWIAEQVFDNERDARWVRAHCPRVTLSPRTIRYLESEIRAWVLDRRKSA